MEKNITDLTVDKETYEKYCKELPKRNHKQKAVLLDFLVGDTLYYVCEYRATPRIEEYTVKSIVIKCNNIEYWVEWNGTDSFFEDSNIGSVIFRTREEAEQRLKELQR